MCVCRCAWCVYMCVVHVVYICVCIVCVPLHVCGLYVCTHACACGMCVSMCACGCGMCTCVQCVCMLCVCMEGGMVMKHRRVHILQCSTLPARSLRQLRDLKYPPQRRPALSRSVSPHICGNMGPRSWPGRPPRALFPLLRCLPLHRLPQAREAAAVTSDLRSQPQEPCRGAERHHPARGQGVAPLLTASDCISGQGRVPVSLPAFPLC